MQKKSLRKTLFSEKPSRERTQRTRGKAEKGGALIRAGAHIRDNTVTVS